MSAATEPRARPVRPWVRRLFQALIISVLAAVGVGGWLLYTSATAALQAEENWRTTLFTILLVERFVAVKERWPRSWEDLEELSISNAPPNELLSVYKWPAASAEIQKRVSINFSADMAEIVQQGPMAFTAIKPIGTCVEYRDYGFIESLQSTIRKSIHKSNSR